jgi:hypothetical protein
MNQRIVSPLAPKPPMELKSTSDPPQTIPSDSTFAQAKRYVESCIEEHPGASIASMFFLGLCCGWLIKRK